MQPTNQSLYDPNIDILRGIAFMLVALVHFSHPLFTTPLINNPNLQDSLSLISLSIIQTGWIGVPMFLFISGYTLSLGRVGNFDRIDLKQFFLNRILRLSPLWILCIAHLIIFHKISGLDALSLFLFQMQSLPKGSPYNIAWSLQLEWACYIFFPIVIFLLNKAPKNLFLLLFFLLAYRLSIGWISAYQLFEVSYSSIFGGLTIFTIGSICSLLKPVKNYSIKFILILSGVILLICFCYFINTNGGYQNGSGILMRRFFLFLPEYISFAMFLLIWGSKGGSFSKRIDFINFINPFYFIPNLFLIFKQIFTHIGKVSYSGYIFSILILGTFENTHFGKEFRVPSDDWSSLFISFSIYLLVLIIFSTLSFYGMEKPFLDLRRR